MQASVLDAYRTRAAQEHWSLDPAQEAVAAKLDGLASALAAAGEGATASPLGWLFGRKKAAAPRGLYIYGEVGRGKTMLMDLFFAAAPVDSKRRVHFHAFMGDVHSRIHEWRQLKKRHAVKGDDPIAPVAEALADQASLLCFDEFAVTDIADAMILGRLFTALFAAGVTVVATSNVALHELYKDGLNRALFLPFITLAEERMEAVKLDAREDFRLAKLTRSGIWFVPNDAAAAVALDRSFDSLAGTRNGLPVDLQVLGRTVAVPQAANGVARFGFSDLCEAPMGAADFLAITQAFHTILVGGIRVMAPGERNVVKRFITLIDTVYDAQVKLIASAAAEPPGLYGAEDGREVFEFQRTVSRLIEMRSDAYLALPHRGASASRTGDTGGLIDT